MDPQEWLKPELPIMKGCHENWTWERYDFPQFAYRLKINWIKVNEKGGCITNLIILMRSTNDPWHAWYGMSSMDLIK